jgi:hypothetical protein
MLRLSLHGNSAYARRAGNWFMKRYVIGVAALLLSAMAAMQPLPVRADEQPQKYEYITIRWDGVDRMCVMMAEGKVRFVGDEMKNITRPDDADKRAFYMTIEMNRLAKQGYEVVSLISDEIIMKRAVAR